MKGFIVGGWIFVWLVIVMILMSCANENILNPTIDISARILGRRVGYQLAMKAPEIADQTRAPATEILIAEDIQSAAKAFGNILNQIIPSVDDPMLAADLADLADIFLEDEFGAEYIRIIKEVAKGYLFGLDLASPPSP